MPESTVSVFGDPYDYRTALRGAGEVDLVVTGHGEFRARLTQIVLSRMQLMAGEEDLPRIAFITLAGHLIRVSLPARDGASMFFDGIAGTPGEIVTDGPGRSVYERTDGPCRWRTIMLPSDDLATYGRAVTGTVFDVPAGPCWWRPMPAALRHLSRLHDAATRMNRLHPRVMARAGATHGLEQQLIDALIECVRTGTTDRGTPSNIRHADIMSRFEDVLRAYPDQAPPVGKICATIGVSDHTLRTCCNVCLGMGPQRYLYLRRMQSIHRALRNASPDATRVSEVARQYGFGGLGRFEVAYREHFGELPSATLRRESDRDIVPLIQRRRA